MNAETVVMVVLLAPFMLAGLSIWTKHKQKELQLTSELSAEKAAQYAQHTSQLEERVRVLERIVTTSGYDLAHQIEALRTEDSDRRLNAPIERPRHEV